MEVLSSAYCWDLEKRKLVGLDKKPCTDESRAANRQVPPVTRKGRALGAAVPAGDAVPRKAPGRAPGGPRDVTPCVISYGGIA